MYHSPPICKVESSLIRIFVKVYLGLGTFLHLSLPHPRSKWYCPYQASAWRFIAVANNISSGALHVTNWRVWTLADVWNPGSGRQMSCYMLGMIYGYAVIVKYSAPINSLTNAARGLQSPGKTHLPRTVIMTDKIQVPISWSLWRSSKPGRSSS